MHSRIKSPLLLALAFAFLNTMSNQAMASSQADEQGVGYGVAKFSGVTPKDLFLGKKTTNGAEKCVHEIIITDAKAACTVNHCINNVFHNHREPANLSYGVRGLLIYNCAADDVFSVKGDLLTDHDASGETVTNIAIFQVDQVGKSLWKQVFKNGEYSIELPTEGGLSQLKYSDGKYIWRQ